MRLRLPEMLKTHRLTAYALAKRSNGRISIPLAYRLAKSHGVFGAVRPQTLAALCDVLQVEPGKLFERLSPVQKRKRG
ncbi:MAG: helix-turn-helix domain-containing protein [Gemmatimonadota bacterium]